MNPIKNRKVVAVVATAAVAGAGAAALPATGNADSTAQAAGKKEASAKLYDNYFDPASMKVKKGTKMKWKDLGATSHNVTLTKGPDGVKKKDFTSGTMGYGSKFSVTFKKKGTYDFVCTFHVGMVQTIKVKG